MNIRPFCNTKLKIIDIQGWHYVKVGRSIASIDQGQQYHITKCYRP